MNTIKFFSTLRLKYSQKKTTQFHSHRYLVRRDLLPVIFIYSLYSYRLSSQCHSRYTWQSVGWTSHQLSSLAHPSAHCVGDRHIFKHTLSVCSWSHKQRACDRKISQPDVGADVHLAALQCRVHGQVNGVGGLAAVVLVDEHWVFCDVKACGIPVRTDVTMVRKGVFFFFFSCPSLKFQIWSADAPSDDDLSGWHPLVELVHVLSELHVHSNLLSAKRTKFETFPFMKHLLSFTMHYEAATVCAFNVFVLCHCLSQCYVPGVFVVDALGLKIRFTKNVYYY